MCTKEIEFTFNFRASKSDDKQRRMHDFAKQLCSIRERSATNEIFIFNPILATTKKRPQQNYQQQKKAVTTIKTYTEDTRYANAFRLFVSYSMIHL